MVLRELLHAGYPGLAPVTSFLSAGVNDRANDWNADRRRTGHRCKAFELNSWGSRGRAARVASNCLNMRAFSSKWSNKSSACCGLSFECRPRWAPPGGRPLQTAGCPLGRARSPADLLCGRVDTAAHTASLVGHSLGIPRQSDGRHSSITYAPPPAGSSSTAATTGNETVRERLTVGRTPATPEPLAGGSMTFVLIPVGARVSGFRRIRRALLHYELPAERSRRDGLRRSGLSSA